MWVATSAEVESWATEAGDLESLVHKLSGAIPQMLKATGQTNDFQGSFEQRTGPIALSPTPVEKVQRWISMADFRAQVGMPMLTSNPVLDMRGEERF